MKKLLKEWDTNSLEVNQRIKLKKFNNLILGIDFYEKNKISIIDKKEIIKKYVLKSGDQIEICLIKQEVKDFEKYKDIFQIDFLGYKTLYFVKGVVTKGLISLYVNFVKDDSKFLDFIIDASGRNILRDDIVMYYRKLYLKAKRFNFLERRNKINLSFKIEKLDSVTKLIKVYLSNDFLINIKIQNNIYEKLSSYDRYMINEIHYPGGMNVIYQGKNYMPIILYLLSKKYGIISSSKLSRNQGASKVWSKLKNIKDIKFIETDNFEYILYKKDPKLNQNLDLIYSLEEYNQKLDE